MSDPGPTVPEPRPPPGADDPPSEVSGWKVTDSEIRGMLDAGLEGSVPHGGAKEWQPPNPEGLQAEIPAYKVFELLGRGGMGAVYKGWQISLERYVAIKVLPPQLDNVGGARFAERFKGEAKTMAKFQHPGIVSVYDTGETSNGLLYIVMEFIEGTDVAALIHKHSGLPAEQALAITAHVCDALAYAHAHGVFHRDIKPANIMLNVEGQVKVADFGLAKSGTVEATGLTKTRMIVGTADYMAPEASIPGLKVDGRADLYAVGVTLYSMLTGKVPRGMFDMPSKRVGTDPRFDAIIARAMQEDRAQRYQSAHEMRRDLDVILTTPAAKLQQAGAPPHKPMKETSTARPRYENTTLPKPPPKKAHTGRVVGILGATALAVGALVWFGGKQTPPVKVDDSAGQAASSTSPAQAPVHDPQPPQAAKFGSLADMPRNVWVPVLDSPQAVAEMKGLEWRDGWVWFHSWLTLMRAAGVPSGTRVGNLSLHFTMHPPVDASSQVHCVIGDGPKSAYNLEIRGDKLLFQHVESYGTEAQKYTPVQVASIPKDFLKADEWKVELTSFKDRITTSLNGSEILSVKGITLPDPGAWVITQGSRIKDIALKLLDDSAPAVAAATTTVKASAPNATPGPVPAMLPDPAKWLQVFNTRESLATQKNAEWTSGGIHLTAGSLTVPGTIVTDAALRAKVRLGHGHTSLDLRVVGGSKRAATVSSDSKYIHINKGSDRRYADMEIFHFEPSVATPEEIELEFVAVGKVLMVSVDGKVIGSVLDDEEPQAGRVIVSSQDGSLRDIAWQSLGTASASSVIANTMAGPKPGALSQSNSAPAAPALPAELTTLDKEFLKLQAERVTAPFDAEVVKLSSSYLGALERQLAKEKAAGHLDGVLALEDEKKLVGGKQGIPSIEDESTSSKPVSDTLKNLRTVYRESYAKLEQQRGANLKLLTDPLVVRLEALESDLTRKDHVADAKMVKDYREELVAASNPGSTDKTPPSSSVSPGGNDSTAGAMPTAPASKAAFTNSLGMKFVHVPGTKVLFCIHATRVKDYAAYAAEVTSLKDTWKTQQRDRLPISVADDYPVVGVNWDNAEGFCGWLSKKEGRTYRLPTDREWSFAVGIGPMEKVTKDTVPESLTGKIPNIYPWGRQWPPPKGAGNFADTTCKGMFPAQDIIPGYTDGFATTSPVMSYKPNKLGLYDMCGNVKQWCEDWYNTANVEHVLRGGAWNSYKSIYLLSSARDHYTPDQVNSATGFRVVVVSSAP